MTHDHDATCLVCYRRVDTRPMETGGDGHGTQDAGHWICSSECWDIYADTDTAVLVARRDANFARREKPAPRSPSAIFGKDDANLLLPHSRPYTYDAATCNVRVYDEMDVMPVVARGDGDD